MDPFFAIDSFIYYYRATRNPLGTRCLHVCSCFCPGRVIVMARVLLDGHNCRLSWFRELGVVIAGVIDVGCCGNSAIAVALAFPGSGSGIGPMFPDPEQETCQSAAYTCQDTYNYASYSSWG